MGVEYAIVASLLLIGGVTLVRTLVSFFKGWSEFPTTAVDAVDGVLLVIIILDVVHTILGHLRSWVFAVRPFLVIGILAGVREILSASVHLSLRGELGSSFEESLIALGAGVGVVIVLTAGLALYHHAVDEDEDE